MSITDSINSEFKFILVFSIVAVVLSAIIGLISDVGINVVVIRSLVAGLLFAGIAYGVAFILKRYVSELYEILFTSSGNQAKDSAKEDSLDKPVGDNANSSLNESGSMEDEKNDGFKEYLPEEFPKYESGSGKAADPGPRMGKHIVVVEKVAKYEPKIMAQAVRTMLNKDD